MTTTTSKLTARAPKTERPLSPRARMDQAAKALQKYLEDNDGYLEPPE
jgi:hypothetical protein